MASDLVNCFWCGYQNPIRAACCCDCERQLRFVVVCPTCDTQNTEIARYCGVCGGPMSGANWGESDAPPQSARAIYQADVTAPVASVATSLQCPRFIKAVPFALVFIFAIAAILHLVNLADIPPNITADEADNLQIVYHILADQDPGFFGPDWKAEVQRQSVA